MFNRNRPYQKPFASIAASLGSGNLTTAAARPSMIFGNASDQGIPFFQNGTSNQSPPRQKLRRSTAKGREILKRAA